jgi:signal peptidase II
MPLNMNFRINKKLALAIMAAIFFIVIDRFLKILALYLGAGPGQEIIGSLLKFNFAKNYYIAFSLPLAGSILIIIIGAIIIYLLYFWLVLIKKERFTEASLLTFLIIGAISNIYDRLRYGFVIDYLDLKWFTVFNISDALIVFSTFSLIITAFAHKKGGRLEQTM